MSTSYPLHPLRRRLCLDGIWDFAWLGAVDPETVDPSLPCPDVAAVPGVFDTAVDHPAVRGIGLYRCRVEVAAAPGARLRLVLGALGLWGRVWWDGRRLGDIDLPFSPERFDLVADGRSAHELAIAVDNRFDAVRCPLFPAHSDFHAHGGIYRSVTIDELPPLAIERVRVVTTDLAAGRVRLEVALSGAVPDAVDLGIAFDGGVAEPVRVLVADGWAVVDTVVPEARIWSPATPNLHTVRVACASDAVIERFGLRTVSVADGRIRLNGEPLRLRGVNRHEAHPQLGPVQPAQLLTDDLRLVRDLGANFIRSVHYPQDPALLDACDRLGLLVWEESLGWQLGVPALTDARVVGRLREQTRRMVEAGCNHPSAIIWGFLNEGPSDQAAAAPAYAELTRAVRAADPGRLVSYASDKRDRDVCFALADVVAVNLYPGWFDPLPDWETSVMSVVAPALRRVADALAAHPDARGKPLLVSEIGVGALHGFRDRFRAQWSEEFQADYLAEACQAILGDPRWAGMAVWQLFDTRSFTAVGHVRGKPRGFNGAGLLDEYRRPKLAYGTVRDAFRASAG